MNAEGRCRADDFRRKLIGLVGRTASPHYAIDPAVLGGYVRILNRENNRFLWMRVRGRTRFAFDEPRAFRIAFEACTPDELRQLRRESLTHY